MKLFLPIPLSNNNTGQTRHWSAANKQKQLFAKTIVALGLKAKHTPTHKQRVTITRILGKGERLWDADSVLRGNAKQLLDSLVDAGYFVDDGPNYITSVIGLQNAVERERGPAIEVEINDAN